MDAAQLARRILADGRAYTISQTQTQTQLVDTAGDRLRAIEHVVHQALQLQAARVIDAEPVQDAAVVTLTMAPSSCLLLPPQTAHVLIVRHTDADVLRGLMGVPDDAPLPPLTHDCCRQAPLLTRVLAMNASCETVIADVTAPQVPHDRWHAARVAELLAPHLACGKNSSLTCHWRRVDKRARDNGGNVSACCESLKRLCT